MKKIIVFTLIWISLGGYAQNTIIWNAGMNVAPASSGNEHPRITTDASGHPLILWGHVNRAMFSRWNGSGFTTPVMVNPATMTIAEASWMGPDIAAHGDTVYVVFKQTPEDSYLSHIWCVRSFDGGVSFSQPVRVDYIADSLSRFPSVTTDPLGNPVIGFMKFDPSFGDERWVVVRSTDFGTSFSLDVKASGWSSPSSTVCNCCPGTVLCSGNTVAMVYRDNKSDIRDTWAGVSFNGAVSFAGGMGLDGQNWNINYCPASGPDGVIIGDTLYSTFMSGASGMLRVYYSKSSLSAMTGSTGMLLTGSIMGLTKQNYPRMAAYGTALAIAWPQQVNGNDQCVLRFTNNILNGLPAGYDTVDLNNITNTDVALTGNHVFVVWEDDNSGTIKYRMGTYTPSVGIHELERGVSVSIYPNPSTEFISVDCDETMNELILTDIPGKKIYSTFPNQKTAKLHLERTGVYFLTIRVDKAVITRKIIVQH